MKAESVLIPPFITWQQFGAPNPAFFDTYVKGKRLPVDYVYGRILVINAGGQQFNIHESDLITDKLQHEMQDYPWLKYAPVEQFLSAKDKEIIAYADAKIRQITNAKDLLRLEYLQLLEEAQVAGIYSNEEVLAKSNKAQSRTDAELQSLIKMLRFKLQNKAA